MSAHPSQSLWAVPIAQMSARIGQSMHLDHIFPAPQGIGDCVIGIKPGADVHIEGDFDTVVDGLMFHGTLTAPVHAQCSRCLIGLRRDWPVKVYAFFPYADKHATHNKKHEQDDTCEIWDENDDSGNVYPLVAGGDFADVEALIRDTYVTELPLQPLCEPDCRGLCSQCGENLNEHPEHHHDVTDMRFAALEALRDQLNAQSEQTL